MSPGRLLGSVPYLHAANHGFVRFVIIRELRIP